MGLYAERIFSDDLAAEKVAGTSPRRLLLLIMCSKAAQVEKLSTKEYSCSMYKFTNFDHIVENIL